MEYSEMINDDLNAGNICDDNFIKHVGYRENNVCIQKYFSQETVNLISSKVTELLRGVKDRPIIVPNKTICSVMDAVYQNYRPPTGDIYSRYNIPNGETTQSYVQNMIDQTIEIIVSDVRVNLEMEENNKKLSIWTTVLGDFNQDGLRSHDIIKLREKRPTPFQFHMRY